MFATVLQAPPVSLESSRSDRLDRLLANGGQQTAGESEMLGR